MYTKTYTEWSSVPIVINISELCIILRVSETKALNMLKSGEIKATKTNGRWFITKNELMSYLQVA